MPLGNCVSCAFWRPVVIEHYDTDDPIDTPEARAEAVWGTCTMPDAGRGAGEGADTLAYTTDASDYFSALHTRPNFGCVAWEGLGNREIP